MDLYDNYDYGIVTPERRFKVDVNPSGSKQIWKLQSCKLQGSEYVQNIFVTNIALIFYCQILILGPDFL